MEKEKKFVCVAIKSETREKLRRLANLKRTNLNLVIDMIADEELKKILP